MKRIFIALTIGVLTLGTIVSFSGCGEKAPVTVKNKEFITQLKTQVRELDQKLILLENEADKPVLLAQKKETLIKLGEEYVKNYDPQDYSKEDDVFEGAIAVYRELPKLIDIAAEGKSELIETLGRYIRHDIQIIFLAKNYAESYRLAKEMYGIDQSNAGNENLYIDSATNLGEIEFAKENYKEALAYAQEGAAIRYDEKAFKLFVKSSLKLAEEAVDADDFKEAKKLLDILPPLEDPDQNAKAVELREKISKGLAG